MEMPQSYFLFCIFEGVVLRCGAVVYSVVPLSAFKIKLRCSARTAYRGMSPTRRDPSASTAQSRHRSHGKGRTVPYLLAPSMMQHHLPSPPFVCAPCLVHSQTGLPSQAAAARQGKKERTVSDTSRLRAGDGASRAMVRVGHSARFRNNTKLCVLCVLFWCLHTYNKGVERGWGVRAQNAYRIRKSLRRPKVPRRIDF